jgi:Uma2 family endonuclease
MEARMSGAASPRNWSYAEYARLPDDGNRYEVLDGEVLVTPAPGTRHQRIAANLFTELRQHVLSNRLGEVLWGLDVLISENSYLQPDILFIPESQRHRLTERGMEGPPGLVVEVISPGSIRIDRVAKPARYCDFGIPQYWAVDPERSGIWIWDFELGAGEPRLELQQLSWQPNPAVQPMQLEVRTAFQS